MKYFVCYAIREYCYQEQINKLNNAFIKLDEEITSMKQINILKDKICEKHNCSKDVVTIINWKLIN
jgi:hypothetical protein